MIIRTIDVLGPDRRRARDLEVVPRGVPVRAAHEPLERARVRGRRPDLGRPASARVRARSRPGAGCVAPGLPGPAWRDTRGRRRTRRGGPGPLGEPAGEPGRRDQDPPADRADRSSSSSRQRCGPGAATADRLAAGPGSRSPACISRARRSRSAISTGSPGQIGLKLYHWSGAPPILTASASAIACVARCSSAGSVEATSIGSGQLTRIGPVGLAPDGDRAGSAIRSSPPAWPVPQARSSTRRTGGPGCRPPGIPSRPAGPGSRRGAGPRRSRAGSATG